MSVLIKGIDLPKCGLYLDLVITADGVVRDYGIEDEQIAEAIELPDHGDLIDREALMARYAEEVKPSNNSDFIRPPRWNDAVQLTELAPVVIPAERSEECGIS